MKLIFWGLVVLALGYAAYSGMIAAWSWIAVNNAIDEVISREGIETASESEIKARVLHSTTEAGVTLDERDIVVSRDNQVVKVEAMWTIPVIIVKGDPVLAVPLSVRRTSSPTARY
jgi:hypothetical protein